jgi:hypothetical protein
MCLAVTEMAVCVTLAASSHCRYAHAQLEISSRSGIWTRHSQFELLRHLSDVHFALILFRNLTTEGVAVRHCYLGARYSLEAYPCSLGVTVGVNRRICAQRLNVCLTAGGPTACP